MRRAIGIVSFVAAIVTGLPAFSGEALKQRIRCPIGGQRVEIVSTFSCSTGQRATMSLRRPSTCDFVTRLPVCKKQDFPVYREFSKNEARVLREIVKEDWYQAARSKSRYLRAYLIELKLNEMSEKDIFWLLQAGHFYDPQNTYGHEEYYAAFKNAANAYLPSAKEKDKKLILMMASFARIHLGDPKKANAMLNAATQIKTPETPFYDQYLNAVKACLRSAGSPECAPEFVFTIQR